MPPTRPLVLFHGVSRAGRCYAPFEATLGNRYSCTKVDFRGHGAAPRRPGAYHVVDYVEDARAAIVARQEPRVVLYGHSLGAMVAAAAAAEMANRVAAVILEDPPFETMGSRIGEGPLLDYFVKYSRYASHGRPVTEVARELADLRYGPPGAEQSLRLGDSRDDAGLRFTARALADVDPEVFHPILQRRWLQGYDLEAIVRRVECPVLLLQSDPASGGMLADRDVRCWQALGRDVTVVRFPGVGHQIRWSAAPQLVPPVWSFLESLEAW